MEQQITHNDIERFMDQLQLFVPNLGELNYYTTNEHFHYFIKTNAYSFQIGVDQLIACKNKQLTQADFQMIANGLLKTTEPNSEENYEQPIIQNKPITPRKNNSFLTTLLLITIIGAVSFGLFLFVSYYGKQMATSFSKSKYETEPEGRTFPVKVERPKTDEELQEAIRLHEAKNAASIINGKMNYEVMYKNLLSVKVNGLRLKGELKNNAILTSYKNMRVKVKFFSATNDIILTKMFKVYQHISPQETISFQHEIEITNQEYKDIDHFEWNVVGAELNTQTR